MAHVPDIRVLPGRSLRLRSLWHRCWGACAALLGAALLTAAVIGVLIVPDLMADERAFPRRPPLHTDGR